MKRWMIGFLITLSIALLSGCGGSDAPAADANSANNGSTTQTAGGQGGQAGQGGGFFGPRGEPFQSAYLTNTYESALPTTMQLTLGTFELEGTEKAVTPEQAKKLLPLYQGLQSGSIQNPTERNAILKQIENTMLPEQMTTIAEMKLTSANLEEWAKANGIELPPGGFGGPNSQGGPNGQGQGQGGPFANMTEEERTKLREEMQNMTPEERRAKLKELGIEVPDNFGQGGQNGQGQRQGGPGGRGGRGNLLMEPLVKLLTERAK